MTWTLVSSRQPEGVVDLPEQGSSPLACHLNCTLSVLEFENERGERRSVDLTYALQDRAEKLDMRPEDYMAGLLSFAEKAVA